MYEYHTSGWETKLLLLCPISRVRRSYTLVSVETDKRKVSLPSRGTLDPCLFRGILRSTPEPGLRDGGNDPPGTYSSTSTRSSI